MSWKTAYRSFYYQNAPQPKDPHLPWSKTALLCIDVQNYSLIAHDDPAERLRWKPFRRRMRELVIPNIAALQQDFRARGIDVLHARIACLLNDGRDRSLSQKMPGWNNLLMLRSSPISQIVDECAPVRDEIVVTKTTDSALTGTNLRLLLTNMGIVNVIVVGIYTDQCISSTVRGLADESFQVIVLDDCCAAGTDDLHQRELEILNCIYCQVMTRQELNAIMRIEG